MSKSTGIFQKTVYLLQCWLLDTFAARSLRMPLKKRRKLAGFLCWFAFDFLRIRRNYVCETIEKHLNINRFQALRLARKVYFNFFLNASEMASLRFISNEELLEKISCSDLSILTKVLKQGKGAIIISGHFGLWELVPPWLSQQGLDITVVVRRQNNPEVDKWMEKMRQRHGAQTTDSGFGIREILKSLRKGHILALMVDQDNGKQGMFVKFFKHWASAPTGPAAISQKTGAPIVPLALFPDYNGQHRLKIWEPVYPQNFSQDLAGQQQMTAAYSKIIEEIIRSRPEQWFWLHRRWKTQPCDAPENDSVKILNLL